jgi:aryl-alcohol dehydrogenase-like predicted oxidoreductase/spore coat polysaccharide biosynthesis protein SpsF (cytidylyltransferase family)
VPFAITGDRDTLAVVRAGPSRRIAALRIMTTAIRIVLQTRLGSRRLPAKALLPIAGIPMAVLAAKRACRSGIDLVVATSHDPSDDPIEETCRAAGLAVHRGSLDDVHARFLGATAGLADDAVIVRLTGDNVFPDSGLVQALVDLLHTSNAIIAAPEWPESGFPYGVAAEAFRLGALRQHPPQVPGDGEHVTPALYRAGRSAALKADLALAHLRATIDSFDDFLRIRRAFADISDPVGVGWRELCARLARLSDAPSRGVPWRRIAGRLQSQLTLGTAQLGIPYGVANTTGMPGGTEAARIIRRAVECGVTHIDTARGYGESEQRIGAAIEGSWRDRVTLVTKLAPIVAGDAAEVRAAAEASVMRSCHALRTGRLDILLLHRAQTRLVAGGAAWQRLLELKREGVIGLLGVSVQNPEEARQAAADPDVAVLQLPFNLLDHRWDDSPALRPDLLVHGRSVFLQGLLAGAPAANWPAVDGCDARQLLATLDVIASDLGRANRADLAVAFARAQPWIHSIVVGMETPAQLEANLALFAAPPLTSDEVVAVRQRLPTVPAILLDPAQWPNP